jgi:Asp-tRNA(Asn)/Glu-tRNA(Gln) amidotransferase C subunit
MSWNTALRPWRRCSTMPSQPRLLREDVERTTLTNADAVVNAALTAGGYFKVPRVIER